VKQVEKKKIDIFFSARGGELTIHQSLEVIHQRKNHIFIGYKTKYVHQAKYKFTQKFIISLFENHQKTKKKKFLAEFSQEKVFHFFVRIFFFFLLAKVENLFLGLRIELRNPIFPS
jgi:hypothetical protein